MMLWKPPKIIYHAKGEVAVDHSTVTRWLNKFQLGCKNLDGQVVSPKTMNSEAILQAIVTLIMYQVSLASHSPVWFVTFTTSLKASGATELPKYCKTFDSP